MIRLGPARFSLVELGALAAGLAVFGYLAWDEPLWDPTSQALLHLLAGAAVAGLAIMALRGLPVPRSALELPLLVLLVTLGVATITSENPGLSARAFAVSIAWALLLPVALVVTRRRPAITALAVIVPVTGVALLTLVDMLIRRLRWVTSGAPGLPPIRLPGETTAFGSVAVAPFILLACFGLTFLVPHRVLRLVLQAGLILAGIPLALLSGSRSAWIAMGVTALAMLVPVLLRARRRLRLRPRLPTTPGGVAAWIAGVVVLVGGGIYAGHRAVAVSSLLYRENLWRDTLRAWSANPILGVGPGVMPFAREAAAPAGSFPVHQPHSHDLALGVLGDAGIVGLVAALAVVAVFVWLAGPHRSRTLGGRLASSVLIGIGAAGLFEDLTFLPGFDLLVLLLAAVALLDADAVRWLPLRRGAGSRLGRPAAVSGAVLAGIGAIALLVPVFLVDTAAVTYRAASDDAWALRWQAAEAGYQRAVVLDPWQPTGPKALAVAADYAGNRALALDAARRATQLNAGDAQSWANLAILCEAAGDRACALDAAGPAVAYAAVGGRELINAAIVYEKLGDHALADDAFRRSLLTTYDTSFAIHWPRRVDPGTTLPAEGNLATGELALLAARRTQDYPITPERYTAPAVRALAYAMVGDRRAASDALAVAEQQGPAEVLTWDVAVLLQQHWGEDTTHAAVMGVLLRGRPIPTTPGGQPRLIWDIATFRPYPGDGFVASAQRLTPPQGWLAEWDALLPANG